MVRRLRHLLGVTIWAVSGCGDSAPIGIPLPCTGKCVTEFPVSPSHLIVTPGDTARLMADARTADGESVAVRWTTTAPTVQVDSAGSLTARMPGRGWAMARAVTDSTRINIAYIWVVTADTGGQPFISSFHDAATGALLNPIFGLENRDSIDVTFSYVLGTERQTNGPPSLLFEIRRFDSSTALWSASIPIDTRGRGAFARLRVHLTQRGADGLRLFPKGTYDFVVVLPLADGQRLGDRTGFRVTFEVRRIAATGSREVRPVPD